MFRIKLNIASVIIDDDSDLLQTLDARLRASGLSNYELVSEETNLLSHPTDEIRVIVVDHKLERGRTGLEVLKAVKRMNPENFVIGYSGIEDPRILIDYINNDIDRFVNKNRPDDIECLINFIKEGIREAERRTILFTYLKRELNKHKLNDEGPG